MNPVMVVQVDNVTGESVFQTSSNGSADINITGGVVAIDNSTPGVTNAVTFVTNPIYNSAPTNVTTTAYVASQLVKAGPGILYGFSGYNSKGSAQFIQIHDAVNLPAEGAIPKVILTAGATSNFSADFGVFGRVFNNGIYVVNSSTGPTKTIGSADIWFDGRFE